MSMALHHLLGWQSVGYVEMAEGPCKVLEARMKDGYLPSVPIFNMHTREFIAQGWPERYRGVAQCVAGGFPCQPFSGAGKRESNADERNGWPDTLRIIEIIEPEWVYLENVSGLLSAMDQASNGSIRYFGAILGDLAQIGYDVRWEVLSAADVGAPHQRKRLWIVGRRRAGANSAGSRLENRDGWPIWQSRQIK